MKECDTDGDGEISLTDLLILFRRRRKGELLSESSASVINLFNSTVDVQKIGVGGAKAFFDGKAKLGNMKEALKEDNKKGMEERIAKRNEKNARKELFEAKLNSFQNQEKINNQPITPKDNIKVLSPR